MIPVPSGVVRITTLLAAVATFHVVVQGAAFAQLHADHLALGLLGGFANGLGDLFRLAFAEADAAFLIANNNQSGEAKALTTLDGFADAVDRDQTVCEFRCFFPFAARARRFSRSAMRTSFSLVACAEWVNPGGTRPDKTAPPDHRSRPRKARGDLHGS